MGLDVVELIMEVEDAFDVSIPDERAGEIRTVGDLFDFIVEAKRDPISPRNVFLSAATFYRIRGAVCARLGLDRADVRPRILLETGLPRNHRIENWFALQAALDLKLPRLVRPAWLVGVATSLTIAASILIGFLVSRVAGNGAGVVGFMAALLVIGLVAAEITSPYKTEFEPSWATYRGLSHVVLAHNYATLCQQLNSWNPADAWDALKLIIVEQLRVRPEIVTREASFVNDLCMD